MKVSYAELQNRPRTLQSLTGLKIEEFEALLGSFKVAWSMFVTENFKRENRHRAFGGGRKARLEKLEDKLRGRFHVLVVCERLWRSCLRSKLWC